MAPKLIVEVVANTAGYERGLKRASSETKGLERNIGKATRGALAGSGAFRSLGRSIAFASGGFLAFASAGELLRKSIDAARDAKVIQAQLAAQFKASGQSLAQYQGVIDKTTSRLSLLSGFQDDELKASFTTIFRTTGDTTKSLRDLATAADLARAKHLDLNQAALIIAKTEAGNTTLLRRQGFQIDKNASSEKALAQVRAAVAGQARAGTTAQERFGAVLHNTEEIIGTALLPTLNKYLNRGAAWLTQMNESGQLQKDVAAAAKTLGDVIAGVKAVVTPLAHGFKLLGDAVGGTKNEVKLLAGAFVLLKTRAAAINFGLISGSIGSIGSQAETSATKVGRLRTGLRNLGTIAPIAIPITLLVAPGVINLWKRIFGDSATRGIASDKVGPGGFPQGSALADIFAAGKAGRTGVVRFSGVGGGQRLDLGNLSGAQARAFVAGQKAGGHFKSFLDITPFQKAAQTAAQAATAAGARQPLLSGSFATSALVGPLGLPGRVSGSVASPGLVRPPGRVSGSFQFLRDSFTAPLRLQLEQARVAALGGDLKPVLLKLRAAAFRALKSGRLAAQGQIDAYNAIASINDQLAGGAKGDVTKFRHVNVRAMLRGLGLSGDALRRASQAFAQVGPGGTVPHPSRAFALAGGGTFHIKEVHLHGVQNPAQLEELLEKRARSRPQVRRGAR